MSRALGLIATLAVLLGALAGTRGGGDGIAPGERDTGPASGSPTHPTAFGSCASLLGQVRARALATVGPWGLPATPGATVTAERAAPAGAPAPGTEAAPGGGGAPYSSTNVQEPGVEEPDLAVTDGRSMFVVAGGALHALDVDGGSARRIGRLALGALWDARLLLAGDRLLVLGAGGGGVVPAPGAAPGRVSGSPVPEAPATAAAPLPDMVPGPAQETILRLVDVSDPSHLRVLESLRLEGRLLGARRAGGGVRVVVSTPPGPLPLALPAAPGPAAERRATERNRAIVAGAGPATWLPSYRLERAGRPPGPPVLVPCRTVRRPAHSADLGMLTVVTIDPARGLAPVDTDTVASGGDLVYASPGSLYVATLRWDGPAVGGPGAPSTEIHRFDVARPRETVYRGSGSVPGVLLNQWAMSEHAGVLRVASTLEPAWVGPPDGRESESLVTTLRPQGDRLVRVGQIGGLGRGERVQGVRFAGETGYVVTFRQTDPLHVLDLSDPARPAVRGELHVPGYSAYLHPVGEGLLLGVGQDAAPDGRVLGMQISLFDVADPARPARLGTLAVPGAWSEVEGDHHAFLHWTPSGLVVVPVQTGDPAAGAPRAGALGVRVDRSGISRVGVVAHPPRHGVPPPIRRSLVVGATLYTLSEGGVKASDLKSLADRAWIPLP
jgi:hypothetical protein